MSTADRHLPEQVLADALDEAIAPIDLDRNTPEENANHLYASLIARGWTVVHIETMASHFRLVPNAAERDELARQQAVEIARLRNIEHLAAKYLSGASMMMDAGFPMNVDERDIVWRSTQEDEIALHCALLGVEVPAPYKATGGPMSPDWNKGGRAIVGESGAEDLPAIGGIPYEVLSEQTRRYIGYERERIADEIRGFIDDGDCLDGTREALVAIVFDGPSNGWSDYASESVQP
jgi:hypothetical protein